MYPNLIYNISICNISKELFQLFFHVSKGNIVYVSNAKKKLSTNMDNQMLIVITYHVLLNFVYLLILLQILF